jgi:DNA invertase Pin-like site-specific DNA recombinase
VSHPVAYLRKSRVTTDRHVSWEVQETDIKALATRNGDEPEILSDWGKSGRGERTRFRPQYLRLREMIEADEVSVLYAYSLSRLSRSLGEYASLAELCRDHGVRVRLCKEGEFDYSSASGRFTVGILALLAQMEAELAQERARDTIAVRKARGDHVGSAGFGMRLVDGKITDDPDDDLAAVLAAFREVGSYQRAARLLNTRDVATKTGSPWAGNTVRNIIRRTLPARELVARRIEPRVRSVGSFALSRLLRCSCGTFLTGRNTRKYKDGATIATYVSYQCYRGRHIDGHPRPYMVSERELMPWIRAEADRYRLPEAVEIVDDASGRRDELEARRAHVTQLALVPGVDLPTVQAQLAEIDDRLASLEDEAVVQDVGPIDWENTPSVALNGLLRAYWREVRLDDRMRPIEADWRIARMRPRRAIRQPRSSDFAGHHRSTLEEAREA